MLKYKIAKNTILSAVSEGSNLFLFLTSVLAARLLGDYYFGVFSFGLAFVGLFQILPEFGIGFANTIEVSRDQKKARLYFCNSLGLQIVMGFITLFIIYLIINLTKKNEETKYIVYILSAAMLLKSFKTTFRWIFKSFGNFGYEALTLLIERILTFVLCLIALLSKKGLFLFVLVFTGSRVLDLALTAIITGAKFFIPLPRVNIKLWWDFIKRGFKYVIVGAMITITFQIDSVLLSFMRNPQEVGWYSASYKLIEILTAIPRIVGYAILPTVSMLFVSSRTSITQIYKRTSKYMFIIALPLTAILLLRAGDIINIIFGSGYERSIISLKILIPSIIFMFQSNLGETVLAGINRWRMVIYSAGIATFANVVLNLLLIPLYGYIGSGIATIISEFLYCYFIYICLVKAGHPIGILKELSKPLIATILLLISLFLGRNLGIITAILLSGIIYLFAIVIMGSIDKDEWQLLVTLPRKLFTSSGKEEKPRYR